VTTAPGLASDKPILCADTCSILDILRDPTRETFGAKDAEAALALVDAFDRGLAHCIVAEQVRLEFADHVEQVETETTKAVSTLQRRMLHVYRLAMTMGATGTLDLSVVDDHAARSRAIAERFLACGTTLQTQDDIVTAAFRRMTQTRTPARRGKDSFKDCIVVETYLAFAAGRRSQGYSCPIVFVSSNTADYMRETRTTLAGDIATEFASVGIDYTPNFRAALHYLGLSKQSA
jgi:hypothetical protein